MKRILTSGTYVLSALIVFFVSCKKDNALQSTVNKSPVANAGANATYYWPEYAIELNGSGTDSDGFISRYEWSVLLGPNHFPGRSDMNKISTRYSPKTTVYNLNPGKHAFLLFVADDKGATEKDWVTIDVIDTLTKSGKEYVHHNLVCQSDNGLFLSSYMDYNFLSVSDDLLYYNPGRNMEVWIMLPSAPSWQPVPKASPNIPSTVFEYSVAAGVLFIRRMIYSTSDNLEGTKASIKIKFL